MSKLTRQQDAFGQALYDCHLGRNAYQVIERDDGLVGPALGMAGYFSEYKAWPAHQRKGLRLARGRVLDIGCGAGRHALYLQEKGLEVVGIDNSPLAVRVCRLRGLKDARLMSITQLSRRLGTFDTVLMYGNNFGLFGGFRRARWLLRRLHRMTSSHARIIAESRDPYQTDQPCHLRYHRLNRRRGRMPGQLRIRTRYQTCATPFFDYLLVSPQEMRRILDGTGWRAARFIHATGGRYVAVIQKQP